MAEAVFVATTFDKTAKGSCPILDSAEASGWVALHPLFNWHHAKGQEALTALGLQLRDLPISGNKWNQILERDYWAISKSKYLVFDLDKNPGEHFLAAAVLHKVPVVLVSDYFTGLTYPHFSGYCRLICTTQDVGLYLGVLSATDQLKAKKIREKENARNLAETPGGRTDEPKEAPVD